LRRFLKEITETFIYKRCEPAFSQGFYCGGVSGHVEQLRIGIAIAFDSDPDSDPELSWIPWARLPRVEPMRSLLS
jgi:hypothetical protein